MFTDFQTAGKLLELLADYMKGHSIEVLVDTIVIAGVIIYFFRKRFSKDRWL